MGLFKEDEVVDYTLLKKKGLIHVPEIPRKAYSITSDEFVDVSANKKVPRETVSSANSIVSSASNSTAATTTPSFASFFGDASSTATGSSVQTYYGNDSSNSSNSRPLGAEADLSALKIKIEDVEYKLDRLLERLDKLESTNK